MESDRPFLDRYSSVTPGISKSFVLPEPEPEEDPYFAAMRFLLLLSTSGRHLSKPVLGIYYFLLSQPSRFATLSTKIAGGRKKRQPRPEPTTFSEKYLSLRPWRQLYDDALGILVARGLIGWEMTTGAFSFFSTVDGNGVVAKLHGSAWEAEKSQANLMAQTLVDIEDYDLKRMMEDVFPELVGGKVGD